jgi:CheY-like chemotaxis protein
MQWRFEYLMLWQGLPQYKVSCVALTIGLHTGGRSHGTQTRYGAYFVRSLGGWMTRVDASTSAGIRILLVDDHAMIRQCLRTILDGYADTLVIGEAANGIEAIAMASDLRPDVIIMDVNMPQLDGIAATHRIKTAQPAVFVIGLSANASRQVMEAMQGAGADAFLSKEAAAGQLHDAITALANGARSESTQ